ncbi:MAG: homoserine dehydrogenase [Gemmatimonadaceae bacterium]
MTPSRQIQSAIPRALPQPAPSSKPRTVRVALAGCGVVGGGLVRLLHESSPAIAARYGVNFKLTRVLVRDVIRDRQLPLEAALFTNDLDSFLADDAEVVVEALGGDEPARTVASSALARGKKFITANKQLVAAHGEGLAFIADQNETGLDFGAAVGGSAPVISTLRDLVGASTPLSVRGILNGTSNYVISLLEQGTSLDAALASACERGLAEADCDRDLDGQDAAAKLAIVAWIAFGIPPRALNIRRVPLIPGIDRLVGWSGALGGRLRYIAECVQLPGNRVAASVEPVVVAANSSFGRTKQEENRVEVDLGWGSPLSISGPGAGSRPTASALLSDLLRFTPPPNVRGAGGTAFTSVADPRSHHWLIGGISSASVASVARAVGLTVILESDENANPFIVTAPLPWTCVQRLVSTLEAAEARVCVARYALLGKETLQ